MIWGLIKFVLDTIAVLIDVLFFWLQTLWQGGEKKSKERQLMKQLEDAKTQEEWMKVATELDKLRGFDKWRENPVSKDYDYSLIQKRLSLFRKLRESNDIISLMFWMRSDLSRNIGGIANHRLFEYSLVGTKKLIEEYMEELITCLEFIADWERDELPIKQKIEFFAGLRQLYGRSAFLLSGGATLGLYHMGVMRCLFKNKLIPRIFSGSSAGSLMASFFCTKTDEELPLYFNAVNLNLEAIEKKGEGTFAKRWKRIRENGYLFDISVLQECIRSNIGDLTFLEAYNRTRRVLNITVSSNTIHELPRLLNYLTAPNVLIWSAASASCAIPGVYSPVQLMAKASDGSFVVWHPAGSLWVDGSVENDLPMAKISEQFNVNHFIVSQVNPHVFPFLGKKQASYNGLAARLTYLVLSELSHRINQALKLDVFPASIQRTLYWAQMIVSQKYQGNITIVPPASFSDFLRLMSNHTPEEVNVKMDSAEKATWPKLPLIRMHFQTENTIDNILYKLRVKHLERRGQQYKPLNFALALVDDQEDEQPTDKNNKLYKRSASTGANMYMSN